MEPGNPNGAETFDVADRDSWYFGKRSREETNEILMKEKGSGVFLIRDCQRSKHDYVLSVRESNRVNHYIINTSAGKAPEEESYRIGDHTFASLEELLDFYRWHYLETAVLSKPAPKEKLIVLFDYEGRDTSDLPIRKGEILTLIYRLDDDPNWLVARNEAGRKGEVPSSYVEAYNPENALHQSKNRGSERKAPMPVVINRKLPARARVIKQRVPSAYDDESLRLDVGEIVTVTVAHTSGMWEGFKDSGSGGRVSGTLPFNFVQFMEDEPKAPSPPTPTPTPAQTCKAEEGRNGNKNLTTISEAAASPIT